MRAIGVRCSLWLCGLALSLLVGCQSGEPASSPAERIDVPAGPGSGQPHLHGGADGPLWMSWVEPVDTARHALRYATFDGTAWSEPETAAQGTGWFVNWADVPSLRPLPDGRLAAHYLKSSGSSVYAYDVRITQTTAEGTWQEAITPHQDGTPTEHGFVSLLPWDGDLLAIWLDGRQMETSGDGHGGAMTLRTAMLSPSGDITRSTLLDDRTCECCSTTAVRTASGALVAYRNRTPEEIRNINLIRFDGTAWSEPYLLHDDGWQINGCPVNGPALAADGDRVVAAWFTAAGNTPRVKVAFSDEGGRQFGNPIVVDGEGPLGRVDAVLLDDGSALVSWVGTGPDSSAIRARHVRPDGTMGAPVDLAAVSAARSTGMPRMVRTGDRIYLAWVDAAADRVRLARAAVRDLM